MPFSRFVILISILFSSTISLAQDIAVFEIRRPVAMSDQSLPPRDFYINAGSSSGIKEGMIVTVTRRQSLYDNYQNRSPGDLIVPVGELKIIHVQDTISVAREERILDRTHLPTIDYDAIMVGDRLDISSIRAESTRDHKNQNLEEEVIARYLRP